MGFGLWSFKPGHYNSSNHVQSWGHKHSGIETFSFFLLAKWRHTCWHDFKCNSLIVSKWCLACLCLNFQLYKILTQIRANKITGSHFAMGASSSEVERLTIISFLQTNIVLNLHDIWEVIFIVADSILKVNLFNGRLKANTAAQLYDWCKEKKVTGENVHMMQMKTVPSGKKETISQFSKCPQMPGLHSTDKSS